MNLHLSWIDRENRSALKKTLKYPEGCLVAHGLLFWLSKMIKWTVNLYDNLYSLCDIKSGLIKPCECVVIISLLRQGQFFSLPATGRLRNVNNSTLPRGLTWRRYYSTSLREKHSRLFYILCKKHLSTYEIMLILLCRIVSQCRSLFAQIRNRTDHKLWPWGQIKYRFKASDCFYSNYWTRQRSGILRATVSYCCCY